MAKKAASEVEQPTTRAQREKAKAKPGLSLLERNAARVTATPTPAEPTPSES